MAHHHHHHDRDKRRFDPASLQDTQTITVSDNRALKHALAAVAEQRRLGYPEAKIHIRVSDIPDNTRPRKDARNLGSQVTRNRLNNLVFRRDPEKLTLTDKVRHFNAQDWSYDLPKDHPICKRRKERKEVMFATRKAGRGGQKSLKLPRINIRCK